MNQYNQFGEPIENNQNNEGDQNQEQAVQGEEENENEEDEDETDEDDDDDETDEDEGLGNEIEDLRREAAELRQTLADRKRELSAASMQKTQKILQWFNNGMQPVAVPVAVGGGGVSAGGVSGGVEQVGGNSGDNQMPNPGVVMRPSRQARLLAWARTRPQWQPEYDRLRQRYDGFASEQEVEIYTFVRVLELNGLAPPGLEPRRPGNQGQGGDH